MPRATKPSQRVLRVYAFDPLRGARFENHLTIRVPYEPLMRGPVGRKIAVIDYDASNRCYYQGVDLDDTAILAQNGLSPSESDPQYHQQMVYAVVMDTIQRFEVALGRQVKWIPDRSAADTPFHGLLKIFPHAMQEANAFYDPHLRALIFGYFKASEVDSGTNLPGQVVFTCLSHDIVVHETTHAILDGIRDHFDDPTGPDAPAFHEGFADVVALLQHFSFKGSLLDTIQRTGGLIHRRQLEPDVRPDDLGPMIQAEIGEDNPMVGLARQFGEAMGHRKALRSALGTPPDARALETSFEPHERGAILVAAVFDAFFSVYIRRTRDLIRMAYPDGRALAPNFLHADLANRLAEEAAKTATRIQTICLRALDYCPPVDITFGDYLRALVTADREAMPDDEAGYRSELIHSFRSRGIRPDGVVSYGEDALTWDEYHGVSALDIDPSFRGVWKALNQFEDAPDRQQELRLYYQIWETADDFQIALGLKAKHKVFVRSLYPLYRVRPDGSLQQQIVAELIQRQDAVEIDPDDPTAGRFTFRGGTTVLIDREGHIRYAICKPIHGQLGNARLERQRSYLRRIGASFPLAPYVRFDATRNSGFRGIHRGY